METHQGDGRHLDGHAAEARARLAGVPVLEQRLHPLQELLVRVVRLLYCWFVDVFLGGGFRGTGLGWGDDFTVVMLGGQARKPSTNSSTTIDRPSTPTLLSYTAPPPAPASPSSPSFFFLLLCGAREKQKQWVLW